MTVTINVKHCPCQGCLVGCKIDEYDSALICILNGSNELFVVGLRFFFFFTFDFAH